jgi:aspartokinase
VSKATDQLIRIARAGGGFYVDASRGTDKLIKIARAAAGTGAEIVVTNASKKTTDQLIEIAKAGDGCVMFDLTD